MLLWQKARDGSIDLILHVPLGGWYYHVGARRVRAVQQPCGGPGNVQKKSTLQEELASCLSASTLDVAAAEAHLSDAAQAIRQVRVAECSSLLCHPFLP